MRNRLRRSPRSRDRRLTARNEQGFQLVELLVAVGITTWLMASILDALALTHRQSTATQNQAIAANVAQQLLDDIRNCPWATVSALPGTTLTSNAGQIMFMRNVPSGGSFASVGPGTPHVVHPRGLIADMTAGGDISNEAKNALLRWHPSTPAAQRAAVTETFTWQTVNEVVQVDITVDWPAEDGSGRQRMTTRTLVSRAGIHN